MEALDVLAFQISYQFRSEPCVWSEIRGTHGHGFTRSEGKTSVSGAGVGLLQSLQQTISVWAQLDSGAAPQRLFLVNHECTLSIVSRKGRTYWK